MHRIEREVERPLMRDNGAKKQIEDGKDRWEEMEVWRFGHHEKDK